MSRECKGSMCLKLQGKIILSVCKNYSPGFQIINLGELKPVYKKLSNRKRSWAKMYKWWTPCHIPHRKLAIITTNGIIPVSEELYGFMFSGLTTVSPEFFTSFEILLEKAEERNHNCI